MCHLLLPRMSRRLILSVTQRYLGDRVTQQQSLSNIFRFPQQLRFPQEKGDILIEKLFFVELLLLIFVLLYFHVGYWMVMMLYTNLVQVRIDCQERQASKI